MTRSESDVRRAVPGRGARPARVPRATPPRRRPRPVEAEPAARPAAPGPVAAQPPAALRAPAEARSPGAAPRRGRAPRAPFVLLLVGLLCGGLVTLLLLNTVLAQGSFRESDLRNDITELTLAKETRENDNRRAEQPGVIAGDAEKRGRRPDWDSVNALDPGDPAGAPGAGDVRMPGGQKPVESTDR
ncbi:hypothetical protein [Planobispora longispora]|uniref:Uncharacterized protein n=1 Tax=Planobispora longispora TaxID=28887 RepID=A0A8J3RI93_9ACTN|nr:hypothetical protein [Planobispora longispora]GIH74169.1 hypothetical protein Plo01_05980 [Planobispora longispora]